MISKIERGLGFQCCTETEEREREGYVLVAGDNALLPLQSIVTLPQTFRRHAARQRHENEPKISNKTEPAACSKKRGKIDSLKLDVVECVQGKQGQTRAG